MLHPHPIALTTALLCVPALFAQEPVRNPEQLLVKGNGYELYSMPGKGLSAEKTQLDFAVSRFKSLFGIDPPTLAVVIHDSPEKMSSFDDSALKARGLAIYRTLDAQAAESIVQETHVIGATGWVLKSQNRVVRVETSFTSPGGEAQNLQAGDILKSFGGKDVNSAMQVGNAYDALPAGADFSMEIQRENQALSLNLKKGMGAAKVEVSTPQIQRGPITDGLSHEAIHFFNHAYANRILGKPGWWQRGSDTKASAPSSSGPAYGHPNVPDWFDEAVGTWGEAQKSQARRWALLQKQPTLAVPLERLFTMEHPSLAQTRQIMEERVKSMPSGGNGDPGAAQIQLFQVSGDTVPGAPKGLDRNPEEGAFYAESMAFVTYLQEKEGPAFLRATLESLIKGQSMSDVIKKGKTIPKEMEPLTKDFQAFIAKRNPAS